MTDLIAARIPPVEGRVGSTMKSLRLRNDVWPQAMEYAQRDDGGFSHVVNSLLAGYVAAKEQEDAKAARARTRKRASRPRTAPLTSTGVDVDPFAASG